MQFKLVQLFGAVGAVAFGLGLFALAKAQISPVLFFCTVAFPGPLIGALAATAPTARMVVRLAYWILFTGGWFFVAAYLALLLSVMENRLAARPEPFGMGLNLIVAFFLLVAATPGALLTLVLLYRSLVRLVNP